MSGMSDYVVFNTQTGEVIRYGICQGAMVDQQVGHINEAALPVKVDPQNEYIDLITRLVTPLKTMAIVQSGLLISGLPNPCKARVEGQTYTVGDGNIEFDFTYPGLYKITLTSPEYRSANVTIQV